MSESNNFVRLVVLYSRGGTMVLNKLLEKYSKPNKFSDYMFIHQNDILRRKNSMFSSEFDLIVNRKTDMMDVTLLCKLAFWLFSNKMTAVENKAVNDIKEKRNEFFHSDILKTAKVGETLANNMFADMSTLLKDTAAHVGDTAFVNDVERLIDETERNVPKFTDYYNELKKACTSNEDLMDKIEGLHLAVVDAFGK